MILPPHSTAVLNHLVRSLELENKVTSTCNQLIVFLFFFMYMICQRVNFHFLKLQYKVHNVKRETSKLNRFMAKCRYESDNFNDRYSGNETSIFEDKRVDILRSNIFNFSKRHTMSTCILRKNYKISRKLKF